MKDYSLSIFLSLLIMLCFMLQIQPSYPRKLKINSQDFYKEEAELNEDYLIRENNANEIEKEIRSEMKKEENFATKDFFKEISSINSRINSIKEKEDNGTYTQEIINATEIQIKKDCFVVFISVILVSFFLFFIMLFSTLLFNNKSIENIGSASNG